MQSVGRCIDVEVGEFHRQRYQFVEPGKADMATDDDELRKIEQHVLEIRNEPPGLRALERSGVADLGAEWHAGLHAGGVDRVVTPIVRRQIPKPRDDAHADESLAVDPAANSRTAAAGWRRSALARPRNRAGAAAI